MFTVPAVEVMTPAAVDEIPMFAPPLAVRFTPVYPDTAPARVILWAPVTVVAFKFTEPA